MNLHDAIRNDINDLQKLLNETTEQALIDKARTLWEKDDIPIEDDARYEVLEHFLESEKFAKTAGPFSS
jgi:gamma-glutamylcysteine synthetase